MHDHEAAPKPPHDHHHKKTRSSILLVALVALVVWTGALGGLLVWRLETVRREMTGLALSRARAFFQQIVATRYWNASVGPVYVPVTDKIRPNPYLRVPNRDLRVQDGRLFTMINPAYMTRQLSEIAASRDQVRFHITSSRLVRPANAPDAWERRALRRFAHNTTKTEDYYEWIGASNRAGDFRYMAPLFIEKPCLKCHSSQGYHLGNQSYSLGDLRGGISVSFASEPFMEVKNEQQRTTVVTYAAVWLLGVIGVGMAFEHLRRERAGREKLIRQLETALDNVRQLSGLLPICSSCKKVRNDEGYWEQVEVYLQEHADVEFTHGLCPECVEKLYGDDAGDG